MTGADQVREAPDLGIGIHTRQTDTQRPAALVWSCGHQAEGGREREREEEDALLVHHWDERPAV